MTYAFRFFICADTFPYGKLGQIALSPYLSYQYMRNMSLKVDLFYLLVCQICVRFCEDTILSSKYRI